MISLLKKNVRYSVQLAFIACLFFTGSSNAGVGEAAVITLIFPPGARATGLGEAFTGLADDVSATYYNPAGLGQAPLAHSWKTHLMNSDQAFTAIAAKKKKEFGLKDRIWVGTNKGLLRYNGKHWENSEIYLLELEDNLESVASRFLKTDDEVSLKNAMWQIRTANKIGMKRHAAINELLRKALIQKKESHFDSIANDLSRKIIEISSFERSTKKISSIIVSAFDSTYADTLSSTLENIFLNDDINLEDLQELKIPFTIAFSDSVSALLLDESDRIWIGTSRGIWKYNGSEWYSYSVADGLPSNKITSLALAPNGDIAAGTENGIAIYSSGDWKTLDSTYSIPSQNITSVVYDNTNALYIGTLNGLAKIKNNVTTVYDTTSGLLSLAIRTLFLDSDNRLWIGGENGLTIYDEVSWKRYKFPQSTVTSFAQQNSGTIWIGTNKGAISYKAKKPRIDDNGNTVERAPEWKSFHSKNNSLKGDNVTSVNVHDNDVWLATNQAINQYDNANRQTYVSYEQLLPAMHIQDLFHIYLGMVWPTQDWGTFGFSFNYVNMGTIEMVDALGRAEAPTHSWEGVFNLSYGLPVKEDFSLGMNGKFVISALAPGSDNGDGVGTTFAIDAALLKRNFLIKKFDVGFMLQNMGPNIYYVDRKNVDPIPFTMRLGLVYRAIETPLHDLSLLLDLNKEIVKNHFVGDPDPFWKAIYTDFINDKDETAAYELQETNYNLGMEYWYSNFLALRTGFLFDYIGERYELTIGTGIKYSTIHADFSYIVSPEGFLKPLLHRVNEKKEGGTGVRNGQWRASFLFDF